GTPVAARACRRAPAGSGRRAAPGTGGEGSVLEEGALVRQRRERREGSQGAQTAEGAQAEATEGQGGPRRQGREAPRRTEDRRVAARSRACCEQRRGGAVAGRARAARVRDRRGRRAARPRRARRSVEGVLRQAQAAEEGRAPRDRQQP